MSINIISSRDCLPYLTSLIVCKDIFPLNRLQDTGIFSSPLETVSNSNYVCNTNTSTLH